MLYRPFLGEVCLNVLATDLGLTLVWELERGLCPEEFTFLEVWDRLAVRGRVLQADSWLRLCDCRELDREMFLADDCLEMWVSLMLHIGAVALVAAITSAGPFPSVFSLSDADGLCMSCARCT